MAEPCVGNKTSGKIATVSSLAAFNILFGNSSCRLSRQRGRGICPRGQAARIEGGGVRSISSALPGAIPSGGKPKRGRPPWRPGDRAAPVPDSVSPSAWGKGALGRGDDAGVGRFDSLRVGRAPRCRRRDPGRRHTQVWVRCPFFRAPPRGNPTGPGQPLPRAPRALSRRYGVAPFGRTAGGSDQPSVDNHRASDVVPLRGVRGRRGPRLGQGPERLSPTGRSSPVPDWPHLGNPEGLSQWRELSGWRVRTGLIRRPTGEKLTSLRSATRASVRGRGGRKQKIWRRYREQVTARSLPRSRFSARLLVRRGSRTAPSTAASVVRPMGG